MALSNIIRRTAVQIAPVAAARFIGRTQRYHHLFSAAANNNRAGGVSRCFFRRAVPSALHHFSTKSDKALLKVIESEIECAEKTMNGVQDVPAGFPFKIEDNPGYETITLTREYQDEQITLEVDLVTLDNNQEEEEETGDDDKDNQQGTEFKIPFVVRISGSWKNGHALEFGCTAYPNEISIRSLTITYRDSHQIAFEGPNFADASENLQKHLHNYLEMRGIKPSTTNFLHEYMINRDGSKNIMWLQNLKEFIDG